MGPVDMEKMRRAGEGLGFRQAVRRLIFDANKQPRTPENFDKFLADLSELLRRAMMGEEFPVGQGRSRGALATPKKHS